MQINNKTARILGSGRFRFIPGKNDFSDMSPKEAAALLADEQFKVWCQLGWVSHSAVTPKTEPVKTPEPALEPVREPEPVQESEVSSTDLTIAKAKKMIADCLDAEALLKWYEAEQRERVKIAIEERLAELDQ